MALDHGAHRPIDEQQPALTRFLELQDRRTRHRTLPRADVAAPVRAARRAAGLAAARDEHGERISLRARADLHAHILESGPEEPVFQRLVAEPQPPVPESLAHPVLTVRAQFQHQHGAAGLEHAHRIGQGRFGLGHVVQRLRQQHDVHRRVVERQGLDAALLPHDVGDAALAGQLPGAPEHVARAVDGDDLLGPARGLERQVALAAPGVDHDQRRQQVSERPTPGGPAAARDELAGAAAVRQEVLLAQPQHLEQPRIVGSQFRVVVGLGQRCLERLPHRQRLPGAVRPQRVVGKPSLAPFLDQPALAEQAEMARDTGLGDAQDGRQLLDVQLLLAEQANQSQADIVSEQAAEGGQVLHIRKSTCIDVMLAR